MALAIDDVLSKSDIQLLVAADVQYATLVSGYKKISKSNIELIASQKTSFLNLLVAGKRTLRNRVCEVLAEKISVGLMAIGKVNLKDVTSSILRMDSTFVSENMINCACYTGRDFSVKKNKDGGFLSAAKQPPSEKGASDASGSEKQNANRITDQLKYICKNEPRVLIALNCNANWKSVLGAYSFWAKIRPTDESRTYVEWLLKMSKSHCPSLYQRYEDNLFTMIVAFALKALNWCRKSLKEVTEFFCVEKPQFISSIQLREVILRIPEQVIITPNTKDLPLAKQIVSYPSGVSTGAPEGGRGLLPEQVSSRIRPLLSLRTQWDAIMNTYKIVKKCQSIKYKVNEHRCFYRFLIEYAKESKPKLSTGDFEEHLRTLVKDRFVSFLSGMPRYRSLLHVLFVKLQVGNLLDAEFVRDTVRHFNTDLKMLPNDKIALCVTDSSPEVELESPPILHLLTSQPHFVEILNVFKTLPDESLAVLCNNSMSFFEWLINLCRKLMLHDADFLEMHLQDIVQQEVLALHSARRCQMTIHHLHSQLCQDHPMLLSPNFLSWCLHQPSSAFSVFQSWVYLKSQTPSCENAPKAPVETPCTSKDSSEDILSRVVEEISAGASMSALLRIIKAISSADAESILQTEAYWFDYLENNIRERKNRQKLADLLAEEAKKCLGVNILHMKDLIALLSNGVTNFVSAEALDYVMSQRRDSFAVSSANYEIARVGLVREVTGDKLTLKNDDEDALMRRTLRYFPSSGSCDVPTLIAALSKGDSYLYKENGAPTEEYIKCFFKVFPMLFYIRDNVVVLTCTALEKRAVYMAPLYPTSTTDEPTTSTRHADHDRKHGRQRKRSRSKTRRRSSSGSSKHRKHRRTSDPASSQGIKGSEDAERQDPSIKEEEDGEDVVATKRVIDGLPDRLIADITANILLNLETPVRIEQLMKELLSSVVGMDDAQRIESSAKLKKAFEKKTVAALKQQDRFKLECDSSCKDRVLRVGIVEKIPAKEEMFTRISKTKVKKEKKDAIYIQRVEVSSTSTPKIDPVVYEISDSSDEGEPGASPDTTAAHGDDDVIKLAPTSEPDVIIREPSSSTSSTPESTGVLTPQYSTTSASSSYLKVADHAPATPSAAKPSPTGSRDSQFMTFFRKFFDVNSGNSSMELLVSSALRRFKGERFTRSEIAFEAFVYDFVLRHSREFVLGGAGTEFGVSWVSHRRGISRSSPKETDRSAALFLNLAPTVCKMALSFLSSRPNAEALLDDVCNAVHATHGENLRMYPDAELPGVLRFVTLVTMIRNLKLFCFGVDSPVVYLRERRRKSSGEKDAGAGTKYKFEMENILQNSSLAEAIILMADILVSEKPASQSALRGLWQAKAPPWLAKVFGTGVSFTLSLRKYEFLFPTTEGGPVGLNESALRYIQGRVRPKKT